MQIDAVQMNIDNKLGFIEALELKNAPKKRIPRAEYHGIFLDLVECKIVHKVESPYFCLKRYYLTFHKIQKYSMESAFLGTSELKNTENDPDI